MQTIQVILHDNKVFTITMENYDSVALADMLNNPALTVVNINGLIVGRNSVKIIVPITTEPTV